MNGQRGGLSTILRLFFVRGCLSLSCPLTPPHRQRTNQTAVVVPPRVCVRVFIWGNGESAEGEIGVSIPSRVSSACKRLIVAGDDGRLVWQRNRGARVGESGKCPDGMTGEMEEARLAYDEEYGGGKRDYRALNPLEMRTACDADEEQAFAIRSPVSAVGLTLDHVHMKGCQIAEGCGRV